MSCAQIEMEIDKFEKSMGEIALRKKRIAGLVYNDSSYSILHAKIKYFMRSLEERRMYLKELYNKKKCFAH